MDEEKIDNDDVNDVLEKVSWGERKIKNSQGEQIEASERHFKIVESVNLRNGVKVARS